MKEEIVIGVVANIPEINTGDNSTFPVVAIIIGIAALICGAALFIKSRNKGDKK